MIRNLVIPGVIQSASVTEPAQREFVTYRAVSYDTPGIGIVGAFDEYPINSPLPIDANDANAYPNIMPAKAGDPCLFIKREAKYALIVLTEMLQFGPCAQ